MKVFNYVRKDKLDNTKLLTPLNVNLEKSLNFELQAKDLLEFLSKVLNMIDEYKIILMVSLIYKLLHVNYI